MAKQRATKGGAVARSRTTTTAQPATKFGHVELLIAAGLAAVTFAIYAQVISHHFISFDDDLYIKENPMVNRGLTLAGLAWAFTTFHAANWHPLTWIAHMIDSQIFGMNAGGHLLVNTFIHIANTLLVFWFVRRTTRALWPSALVAALFALHPLHVQSVAWAAERKDTLATLFGLLSLILYCRYAEAPSFRRYVYTAVAFALGLMAKPMLVTWPFVMLLLDYWPLRRLSYQATNSRKLFGSLMLLVYEKLPLFGIAAASAVITVIAQSHGGTVRTFVDFPIWSRLSNAIVSYAWYFVLTFWPHDLAVYYPFVRTGIPQWQIIGAIGLLSGLTAICLFQAKSRRYLLVGWFWFLGTLIPVVGIVQVGGQTMADRYHYVPSIGLFIAIVFGLADMMRARSFVHSISIVPIGVALLALGFVTVAQIRLWHDSVTLFKHTLAITPPNLIIENNLGLVLGRSGNYEEAAAHLAKAIKIKPDFFDALLNMGNTRFEQGRLAEAAAFYNRAIAAQPGSAKAHFDLSLVLVRQNKNEAALDELKRAAQLAAGDFDIHTNLGLMLMRLGRISEAVEQLREALRLNPDNAEAHNNLGLALLVFGKAQESIPEFEIALRLKPELKVASENLRRAQAQLESSR